MGDWAKYDPRRIDGLSAGYQTTGRLSAGLDADINQRQRDMLQAILEKANANGDPARWVNGLSRKQTQRVSALFMFGPAHGKTMLVNPGSTVDVALPVARSMFDFYDTAEQVRNSVGRNRINTHRYRRMDQFSSAQGEDVTLYIHDENCCDDTMEVE